MGIVRGGALESGVTHAFQFFYGSTQLLRPTSKSGFDAPGRALKSLSSRSLVSRIWQSSRNAKQFSRQFARVGNFPDVVSQLASSPQARWTHDTHAASQS